MSVLLTVVDRILTSSKTYKDTKKAYPIAMVIKTNKLYSADQELKHFFQNLLVFYFFFDYIWIKLQKLKNMSNSNELKKVSQINVNPDWRTASVKYSDGTQNSSIDFSEKIIYGGRETYVGDVIKEKQNSHQMEAQQRIEDAARVAEQKKEEKFVLKNVYMEYVSKDFQEKLKQRNFGKYKITKFIPVSSFNSNAVYADVELELIDKSSFIDVGKIVIQCAAYVTKELMLSYRATFSGSEVNYVDLTPFKTYLHYKFGNGRPLYVDISNLNLTYITLDDFFKNGKFERVISVNLTNKATWSYGGILLGKVDLEYTGNNMVKIRENKDGKRYYDTYDFNIEKEKIFSERNILTAIAGFAHNIPWPIPDLLTKVLGIVDTAGGTPYDIYFRGETKLGTPKKHTEDETH